VLNYVSVTGLKKNYGKVSGVVFRDEESDQTYEINSKSVINATGVFVDAILDMDDKSSPAAVMPSQGVHLVIDKQFFPSDHALMIPKTRDGRVLFAVPWKNKVVLGTTDTPLQEISEEPAAMNEEIDFILEHFNQYNEKQITKKDVKSVFAGLRPLVKTSNNKSTALASRDHTIIVSSSHLITITGGKWTTYRKMAKDALNNAVFVAKLPVVKCATRALRLHGYTESIQPSSALSVYGSDAMEIQNMMNEDVSLAERIHPDHAYTKAELIWSIRNEMALQVEDILARRSRILFIDAEAAIASVDKVAAIMAKELNKDNWWVRQQIAQFTELAKGYLP
jgi:glycerol-3-phosphate dehydrogenase